jgi:hypothetical protein
LGVLAGVIVFGGCASGRGAPPGAGSRDYGIWQFREPIVGTQPAMVMEGTLIYQPDTTYVNYLAAPCTYDQRSVGARSVYYRCGEVTFLFDRHNPLQDNSYSVVTNVMVTQRVCVARNTSGACTREDVSRSTQRVQRSGTLRPFRP